MLLVEEGTGWICTILSFCAKGRTLCHSAKQAEHVTAAKWLNTPTLLSTPVSFFPPQTFALNLQHSGNYSVLGNVSQIKKLRPRQMKGITQDQNQLMADRIEPGSLIPRHFSILFLIFILN